ncbi:axin-1-like [Centruroides vittatus]|uniref:axin-1-like n=1 Tax=Centruroides vittatus TaxID=120091 RepID=UPI00350FB8ED
MNDICQPISSVEKAKDLVPNSDLGQDMNDVRSESPNLIKGDTGSYCNFQQYGEGPELYNCEEVDKTGEFWDNDKLQGSHLQSPTGEIVSEETECENKCSTKDDKVECEMTESANASIPNSDRSTPVYLKWAKNLKTLLEDAEGVKLFQKYLKQEKCEILLEFWLACEGLKKYDPNDKAQINQLNKLLYKRYIKQALKDIKPETKRKIEQKINNKLCTDQSIYDPAQKEVEELMMCTAYPNFLESDVYLQHIRSIQNNMALSDSLRNSRSCSSSSSRDGLDVLPTVHEDSELKMERTCGRIPLTSELLRQKNRFLESKSRIQTEAHPNHYMGPASRVSSSCHARYSSFLPTSAQDSELQSLSSDAQTDDTSSLADSSIDCGPVYPTKNYCRKHHHSSRINANLNKDHFPHQPFIPRTHRPPREWLTKTEPKAFAEALIEKLNKVKREQELEEKLEQHFQKLELDDKRSSKVCESMKASFDRFAGLPPQLLSAVIQDKQSFADESDQAILDHHMSRVWKDSATPSRSPVPLSPTPDGHRPNIPGSLNPSMRIGSQCPNATCKGSSSGGLPPNTYQHCRSSPYNMLPSTAVSNNKYRKERDTYSSDSGTVHDFTPENEPTSSSQPVHIHKHIHHHMTNIFSPNLLPSEQGGRANDKRSKENSRSSSSKKTSTDSSSSCFDSGVSVIYDPLPTTRARERVCNWIGSLNEKYTHGIHGPELDNESPPRHKKSSHSSTSAMSGGTNRSSHSKKPLAYSSSRSGSLERGGTSPWPSQSNQNTVGQVPQNINSHLHAYSNITSFAPLPHSPIIQPSQPLAQDPSMPMLPQPDTTTRLVEARRRLEDEARLKCYKGRISSSGREKMCSDYVKYRSGKTIEQLEELGSHKKQNKKSLSSCNNNNNNTAVQTNNENTVIGYCFSGESVPYRTKLPGKNITLKQFKSLLSKKGNYRYFFKKASDEFGTGIINEEISDDNEILPLWEEKIFAIIQPVE